LGLVHILDDAAAKMQRLSAAQAEGIKAGAAGGEPMAQGQA
jgi:hypothetical protein